MQDPKEPPDEGMLSLDEYEARYGGEEEVVEGDEDPDAPPSVTEERLRQLKDQAKKMIEERLRAKRKQRRLMRGSM